MSRAAAGPWPLRLPRAAKGKLRIAVIGTLVDHKGARSVAAVAEAMDPATTEIHLIGHTDGPFPPAALKRMKVTGAYEEAELAALIEAVDPHVIWFPDGLAGDLQLHAQRGDRRGAAPSRPSRSVHFQNDLPAGRLPGWPI